VKFVSVAHAQWHAHVNGVDAPRALHHWLVDTVSLTAKLQAHSRQFNVRRLHQRHAVCLADEVDALGLPRRQQVQEREVLLHCDGRPVVYAHSVVPLTATASDWPFFRSLGERSLGTTLFGDPRVLRDRLQYARLRPQHPLMRRAADALGSAPGEYVFARRCLYRRKRGVLLVTELFLPAIMGLAVPDAEPDLLYAA
jgi:chorismate--pyruvate lyase